jgi:hypothetical protein
MIERDDIVDAIRKELNVEPSASFAAGVRRGIDSRPARSTVGGRGLVRALAVAMTLALVAGRAFLQNQISPSYGPPVTGEASVSALVPQAPESSPLKPGSRPLPQVSRSARPDDGTGLQASSTRGFDPFRDVLVPESERNAIPAVIVDKAESQALDVMLSSVDEPVQIVALAPLARLVIAPLGEGAQPATSN